LAGRYRLERQLGEGGFGTIWRAEQLVLGATVAIKLIDLAIARQAGALDRFLREAQAAAALRSPHVVQVLDYGVDGDQPFIAMELLEGETLAQRLHRLGRLAPSEGLRIVSHIARAVTRAHESNIVHRDLKPDNVFLVRNEDEEVAKVLDFGVAKIKNPEWLEESTQTRTGSLIGTPHYMSPEQVQGNKTVDYRSDLWSMGVIAFEMFTGQRPFVGNALGDLVLQICVRELPIPSHLAPVPAGFDDWFAKAAERDPERRYQSARDLGAALREVVGTERDLELVVADDFDPFRAAMTQQTSALRAESAANVEVAAPIAFAKTMLGEPTRATPSMAAPDHEALPSLDAIAPRDPTGERRLGRIVFSAMAVFVIIVVAIGAVLRSKGATTMRNSATVSTAGLGALGAAAPHRETASSVQQQEEAAPLAPPRGPIHAPADRRASPAGSAKEPVAASAAASTTANAAAKGRKGAAAPGARKQARAAGSAVSTAMQAPAPAVQAVHSASPGAPPSPTPSTSD
jgi:serine/threonine-protein kinase